MSPDRLWSPKRKTVLPALSCASIQGMARGGGQESKAALVRPAPVIFPERFGLSTGWDPQTRRDFARALADAARFSTGTIELSALSARDLPALREFLASADARELTQFACISVHGPAKHLPEPEDWPALIAELVALPAERIILHPDTLPDLAAAAPLGSRLVLENMDCRKSGCRTADELEPVFAALPEARFCLDVAHAWTIDPTLAVGHELLDRFSDRLVEVHLSGIEPDGSHRETVPDDLERYRPLLERVRSVPWVFESPYHS